MQDQPESPIESTILQDFGPTTCLNPDGAFNAEPWSRGPLLVLSSVFFFPLQSSSFECIE